VENYAAIGVSLELSGVCVVDGSGKNIREAKVARRAGDASQVFPRSQSGIDTNSSGGKPAVTVAACGAGGGGAGGDLD
jgi:hypothetical protein